MTTDVIYGNKVIDLLWESGVESRLKEKDEDTTVLDLPAHNIDIGRAWTNDGDEDNWVFDVGDIAIFVDDEFYCQFDGDTPEALVDTILEIED